MKKYLLIAAAIMLASCSNDRKDYDATGVFESTEVTVSAEQTGKLLQLNITEGDEVSAGTQVGLIDTTQWYLKARQIGATQLVYASQKPEVQKQLAATRQQIEKAQQEVDRFTQLVNEGAANRKLLDDAKNQLEVLRKQLEAQSSTLNSSTRSISAQMSTADVEKLLVADQLAKCHVCAPISGIVLEKYAQAGEFAVIGKPLFKVADMRHMYLRAYITSSQLQEVSVGQQVKVFSDCGKGARREYTGTVTWISSKSEFTPKTILTSDERADLVYAMKIAVENDGAIKIGMYGEMKLK